MTLKNRPQTGLYKRIKELALSKAISRIFLALFVISCIFDPADKIAGLKIPLFGCCLFMALFELAKSPNIKIDNSSLGIVAIFLIIPLFGILNGVAFYGEDGLNGLMMFKGYLLILLLPILCILRIDILSMMARALTLLSILIILTFITVTAIPESYPIIHGIGNASGLMTLDKRNYGGEVSFLQIYYVTSPMLVVAIAYYFSLAANSSSLKRAKYYVPILINILGLVLAGSRNNLFIAFLLPAGLLFFNSKYKAYFIPIFTVVSTISIYFIWNSLVELLNPTEYSNNLKLNLISDYLNLFQDPLILLFGQGLGVDMYWSARGYNDHLSELTYFEMVRNFGIFGSFLIMIALMLPVFKLLFGSPANQMFKNMVIAYVCYLLMSFFNPILFSSLGILIVVSVLSYYFI